MTAPTPRRALRLGALLLLVVGLMLLLFSVLLPRVANSETNLVDGASIALPTPGALGSHATVYSTTEGADDQDLGCRLVDQDGGDVEGTLDASIVAGHQPVTVAGATLHPAFEVAGWSDGSRVQCAAGGEFALGAISTFGQATGAIRIGVLAAGLSCLAMAGVARARAGPQAAAR